MKIEDLKEGDPVVYIPNHLLGEKTIKDYQLETLELLHKTK